MNRWLNIFLITSLLLGSCRMSCREFISSAPNQNSENLKSPEIDLKSRIIRPADDIELTSATETRLEVESTPLQQKSCSELIRTKLSRRGLPTLIARCHPEFWSISNDELFIGYRSAKSPGRLKLQKRTYTSENSVKQWEATLRRTISDEKKLKARFLITESALLSEFICIYTRFLETTDIGCFDRKNGKKMWQKRWSFPVRTAPLIHPNKFSLVTSEGISERYPYTGEEMRFHSFQRRLDSTARVAVNKPRVGVYDKNQKMLTGFQTVDATPSWRIKNIPEFNRLNSTDNSFILTSDRRHLRVKAKDGQQIWHIEFDRAIVDSNCKTPQNQYCDFLLKSPSQKRQYLVRLDWETARLRQWTKLSENYEKITYYLGESYLNSPRHIVPYSWRRDNE